MWSEDTKMTKYGTSTGIIATRLYKMLDEEQQKIARDITDSLEQEYNKIFKAFPHFTPHGISHSLQVIKNIEYLLEPIFIQLSQDQLLCLLISAMCHDIGMAPKLFKGESLDLNSEECDLIRNTHHERSERFVNESPRFDKLESHIRTAISRIVKGHRKVSLYSREYIDRTFPVSDLGFLTAIVRLADELEITYQRIQFLDSVIDSEGFLSSLSKDSEIHWKSHLSLTHWELSPNREVLEIYGRVKDETGHRGIEVVRMGLVETLRYIRGIHFKDDFALPISCEFHLKFAGLKSDEYLVKVDTDVVIDWFVGNLYGQEQLWVPIRESVQNAIDACQLRSPASDRYHPGVIVELIDGNLIITDNGRGMNLRIINRYLKVLGRSFNRSGDFEEYLDHIDHETPNIVGKFGIGIFSYFMLCDSFSITSRFRAIPSNTITEWLETRFTRSFCPTFSSSKPSGSFEYGTQVSIELVQDIGLAKLSSNIEMWLKSIFLHPRIPILYGGTNGIEIGLFPFNSPVATTKSPLVYLSKENEITITAKTSDDVFFGIKSGGSYPRFVRSYMVGESKSHGFFIERSIDEIVICIEGTYLMDYNIDPFYHAILSQLANFLGDYRKINTIVVIDFPAGMIEPTLNREAISLGISELKKAQNTLHRIILNSMPTLWKEFKKRNKEQSIRRALHLTHIPIFLDYFDKDDLIQHFPLRKGNKLTYVKDIQNQSEKIITYGAALTGCVPKGQKPRTALVKYNEWQLSEASPDFVVHALVPLLIKNGWNFVPSQEKCPFIHERSRGYTFWADFRCFLDSLSLDDRTRFLSWYGLENLRFANQDFIVWIVEELLNERFNELLGIFLSEPLKETTFDSAIQLFDLKIKERHEDINKLLDSAKFNHSAIFLVLVVIKEYDNAIELVKKHLRNVSAKKRTFIIENLTASRVLSDLKKNNLSLYKKIIDAFGHS